MGEATTHSTDGPAGAGPVPARRRRSLGTETVGTLAPGGNAALGRHLTPRIERHVERDPASGECLYRVQAGDTLGAIAQDLLGSALRAAEVLDLNLDGQDGTARITNPALIRPGDLVRLPPDAVPRGGAAVPAQRGVQGTPEPRYAALTDRLRDVPLPDHPGLDLSTPPRPAAPATPASPAGRPPDAFLDLAAEASGGLSVQAAPVCGGTATVEEVPVHLGDGRVLPLPLVQCHFPYPSQPWIDDVRTVGSVFVRTRVFSRLYVGVFPDPSSPLPLVLENSGVLYNLDLAWTSDIIAGFGLDFTDAPFAAPGLYASLHTNTGHGAQSTAAVQWFPPSTLAGLWFLRQLLPARAMAEYAGRPAVARVGGSLMAIVDVFRKEPSPPGVLSQPQTDAAPDPGPQTAPPQLSPGLTEALRRLHAERPVVFWSIVGLTGAALVAALVTAVGAVFAAEIAAVGTAALAAALAVAAAG